MNILIGITGSVATVKIEELLHSLNKHFPTSNVKIVATSAALHFVSQDFIKNENLFTDANEWESWKTRGDAILHIELRKWADLFIIAPLDANTMAKAANGICDNLLTCILRAWNFEKPILASPAMNTFMWEHPLTMAHMTILKSFGYKFIEPVTKQLVCGDVGMGAMASLDAIMDECKTIISIIKSNK